MRGECAVANWRSGVLKSVSLWDGIVVTLCYSCDATEAQGEQHRAHVQVRVFLSCVFNPPTSRASPCALVLHSGQIFPTSARSFIPGDDLGVGDEEEYFHHRTTLLSTTTTAQNHSPNPEPQCSMCPDTSALTASLPGAHALSTPRYPQQAQERQVEGLLRKR
ncbi:hypothetical protein K443DRAFT_11278 [Laccaria amethystina LaAM-08-1]|uniref:TonB C-terminal domain-containing protein n=1 Tax=Laccaria amethystina LaAM-08-1 TaxID=1095629 RepID=A0A0C9X2W6_9AGAR|nr:hypothetical protein K443DRAFT_11278 [Laccaria amethystina LaAM-08-1]